VQALLLLGALLSQPAGNFRPGDDLTGIWSFRGNCPASGISYRGRLTISGSGPTYDLVWSDSTAYLRGRGLRDRTHLTVVFGDDASGGLMHMRRRGGGWRGSWAYYRRGEICTESWWQR
jgi:hypothetical protein